LGTGFGGYHWFESAQEGAATPAGTVMLAALPILMGMQLVLAFLGYDIANIPRYALHLRIRSSKIFINNDNDRNRLG